MTDIPESPALRHFWLNSRLGNAQDYWVIQLISQNAASLLPPSQDVLGREWTFPSLVAKHSLSSKLRVTPHLLEALLRHFPDAFSDPKTIAWVFSSFVDSQAWSKNSTSLGPIPKALDLFERIRCLSAPDQKQVAQLTEQLLLEQVEKDWHHDTESLATRWMGRQHALDLLRLREPEVPQLLSQSLHNVTLRVLWQCAATYQAETTNAGQTQFVLEDLERMTVSPERLEHTIRQIELLDTPQTKLEIRAFRRTLAANLASAIPMNELTDYPVALSALTTFKQQTDFIRNHLPYVERQENQKLLNTLSERINGLLTRVNAQKMNECLPPSIIGGRAPRM